MIAQDARIVVTGTPIPEWRRIFAPLVILPLVSLIPLAALLLITNADSLTATAALLSSCSSMNPNYHLGGCSTGIGVWMFMLMMYLPIPMVAAVAITLRRGLVAGPENTYVILPVNEAMLLRTALRNVACAIFPAILYFSAPSVSHGIVTGGRGSSFMSFPLVSFLFVIFLMGAIFCVEVATVWLMRAVKKTRLSV